MTVQMTLKVQGPFPQEVVNYPGCIKEVKVDHFPVYSQTYTQTISTQESCPSQHPRVFPDHRIASLMTEMNFETYRFQEGILFDSHKLQIFGIYLICGVFTVLLFI